MLHIDVQVFEVILRHPFQIARGPANEKRETVIVRMAEDPTSPATGARALGEATPIRYLGESVEAICSALGGHSVEETSEWSQLDTALKRFAARFPHLRAAQAGLDFALHDLMGHSEAKPVFELYGLDAVRTPATSHTIGMAAPELLRRKVAEAEPYSILKVKLGTPDDWDTLRLIRSLSDKVIRVDANEAWTAEQAIAMTKRLADYGVELIEQPVPRDDLEGLSRVTEASPIPVIADESCQHFPDVARLAGKAHGINIKLMKCGGIRQGLKMIEAARALGMKVMIGCMIETSIGITAAAHITPLVDYADLDGNLLIRNDPFVGVTIEDGRLRLPQGPGLGVHPR